MHAERRTVMVTGAAGTLGSAVAAAFAGEGANLVLLDRREPRLPEGIDASACLVAPVDLLDAGQVSAAADLARRRFGAIDVLCNIAGGFRMGEAVHETSSDTWDFLFDLNARSVVHAARAVVPGMIARRSGRIVNVAAFAARHGVARMGAYCASKSAVVRLTEAMAAELREQGINVNCVMPTIIDTPENRRDMPDADPANWVGPADLAEVIRFLASPAAKAIHGAALPVTGLS